MHTEEQHQPSLTILLFPHDTLSSDDISCTLSVLHGHFLNLFECCKIDSFRIIYPSVGVAHCDNFSAHLLSFLCCIDRNVSGSGYSDCLAGDIHSVKFHQFFCKVQKSVSCCLCTCKRTAVGKSFSCKDTLIYTRILLYCPNMYPISLAPVPISRPERLCLRRYVCRVLS